MNRRRHPIGMGLASLALVAASHLPRSHAQAIRVVSPPGAEAAEGAISVTPPPTPLRIQYLIPASDFAGLPATHRRLASFNFRGDATQTTSVDWTQPHEQIYMSTTSLSSLGAAFDANHGADKTLVFDGQATYPILGTGPPAGPRPFADGQLLQTPFHYDPAQGNLLIEIRDIDKNYPVPAAIDLAAHPSANILTVFNEGDAAAATGLPVANVVTPIRFLFVPEPSACVLAGVALVGVLSAQRARRVRTRAYASTR